MHRGPVSPTPVSGRARLPEWRGEEAPSAAEEAAGAGGQGVRIPDFKLERYFARWEFSAPYLLCSSDIEGWRLAELLQLADADALRRWEGLSLGYTESAGLPALREAIAGLSAGVHPDEVLTFAGA